MGAASKRLRSPMAETPESATVPAHAPAVAAFTTDVDGRVQSWSREAEHLFGYSAKDIAGRSWSILLAQGGDAVLDAADHQPAHPFGDFGARTSPSSSLATRLLS